MVSKSILSLMSDIVFYSAFSSIFTVSFVTSKTESLLRLAATVRVAHRDGTKQQSSNSN